MMKAHPAAELFPLMTISELQELVEDMRAHGQTFPVVAYKGQILDGRNRWLACEQLGLTPWVTEYDGDDPISFVISVNLKRRHLTGTQRAQVALKAVPLYEKAAKERQRNGGRYFGNHPKPDKQLPPALEEAASGRHHGEAVEQAAKAMDVSPSYVASAKRIATQAPDLHQQVQEGKLSIATAERHLKQRNREQGKEPVNRRKPRSRKPGSVLIGGKSEAAIAQIEAEAERQSRASVAYDVVERLGRCPYTPKEVVAAIPPEQRFRVAAYLKAASEWLEDFREAFTNADGPA